MKQTESAPLHLPFQLCLRPDSNPLSICLHERQISFPLSLPHPVELHVLRHGETASNARSLVTGSSNVLLTVRGRRQAREAGRKLAGRYDVAFTSTLYRTMQTLEIALKAGEVRIDSLRRSPWLDERSLGDLEMHPNRPVSQYALGDLSYAPPGGESYSAVAGKILHFFSDLARWICDERSQKNRKIERVLVCTHMGPMRVIAGLMFEDTSPALVLGRTFQPAQVVKFTWKELARPSFF
ncbi:MAG: histidine phosphatase family protein [Syntrophobacter sp.]